MKLKKWGALILALTVLFGLTACGDGNSPTLLSHELWADDVKQNLNTFLTAYGNTSDNFDENSYAVFDFDNTSSIFDVGEQLCIYQLENMCFAFAPDKIRGVLETGLTNLDIDLSHLGFGKGSYNNWINDIEKAYAYLYEAYGPFTPEGLKSEELEQVHSDSYWTEFATKIRALYNLIGENESHDVSYPWLTYWYTGMTRDEVYCMAVKSHTYYKDRKTQYVTWQSPDSIASEVGCASVSFYEGISVTENIKELWKALSDNGIKVWVCSASQIDVIMAAIDVFGLHDYVTGVLAMTNKLDNGIYQNEYDYEKGYAQYAYKNGGWVSGDRPSKSQTQGSGKVTAINNVCMEQYKTGPIAGFMDSEGDYWFCTEYSSLKLVCCFNRGNRKVTDGGGLVAEVAMYERDTLGYDLLKANENGDTMYLLQGRDENGTRSFRNSNKTLRYGETQEKLFANDDNTAQLQYMIDNKMSVEDILNTFAVKTAESEENVLGFKYGFANEYGGYHSIK